MNGELIKIAALIIIAAVFAVVLRSRLQEYSFLLVLAVVSSALVVILGNLYPQFEKLRQIFEDGGNNSVYFSTALKGLGISYVTGFAANVCRDFGQTALAQTAEIAGKCATFVLSIPLICSVLQSALKFVGL